jgi:hypothetical protein
MKEIENVKFKLVPRKDIKLSEQSKEFQKTILKQLRNVGITNVDPNCNLAYVCIFSENPKIYDWKFDGPDPRTGLTKDQWPRWFPENLVRGISHLNLEVGGMKIQAQWVKWKINLIVTAKQLMH